ncbi:hypothetical protein Lser_V15G30292 [Lactuca serriola]
MERPMNIDVKQKACVKWKVEGDENSKFFHGFINNKNRRIGLTDFSLMEKIKESWPSGPKLMNLYFRSIMNSIKAPFSLEEIKEAIWACGRERAPKPDSDVISCVKHFEVYGNLAAGCNSLLICHVLKIKDPSVLSEYKLISLIGCVYKIIAKALASRLKSIIGFVIDDVQYAYIKALKAETSLMDFSVGFLFKN